MAAYIAFNSKQDLQDFRYWLTSNGIPYHAETYVRTTGNPYDGWPFEVHRYIHKLVIRVEDEQLASVGILQFNGESIDVSDWRTVTQTSFWDYD